MIEVFRRDFYKFAAFLMNITPLSEDYNCIETRVKYFNYWSTIFIKEILKEIKSLREIQRKLV